MNHEELKAASEYLVNPPEVLDEVRPGYRRSFRDHGKFVRYARMLGRHYLDRLAADEAQAAEAALPVTFNLLKSHLNLEVSVAQGHKFSFKGIRVFLMHDGDVTLRKPEVAEIRLWNPLWGQVRKLLETLGHQFPDAGNMVENQEKCDTSA